MKDKIQRTGLLFCVVFGGGGGGVCVLFVCGELVG